ncbi:MAG: hypothetical protein WKF74_01745 [Pyrinomonadaceae bacterium]
MFFIRQFSDDEETDKKNTFTDRTIHRLCFKASVGLFVIFIAGDILLKRSVKPITLAEAILYMK